MATITFNDQANAEDGEVRFVFGATDFTLKPGESYETEDPYVIREAINHTYLHVEIPEDATAKGEMDNIRQTIAESKDPTVNAHVDHLSPVADEAVVKEAQANADRDRAIAAGKDPDQVTETTDTTPAGTQSQTRPDPSGNTDKQSQPAETQPPAPVTPAATSTTQETHE